MSAALPAELPSILIEDAVRATLAEDFGRAGDVTSQATIGPDLEASAQLVARQAGWLCGMDLAAATFARVGDVQMTALARDGEPIVAGQTIGHVRGRARDVLAGERVALNFLGHLSGIATATHAYVERIGDAGARMCCTRKTVPGLRALAKYAVRCGGGSNHRFGLDDAILIKDNHVAVCGGVAEALSAARAFAGHLLAVEIEVDTLEQLREALAAGADTVLLDNFTLEGLAEAVAMTAGRARLEASGGVSLETVAAIAATGVDFISSSRITMSAPQIDIGLDIVLRAPSPDPRGATGHPPGQSG